MRIYSRYLGILIFSKLYSCYIPNLSKIASLIRYIYKIMIRLVVNLKIHEADKKNTLNIKHEVDVKKRKFNKQKK